MKWCSLSVSSEEFQEVKAIIERLGAEENWSVCYIDEYNQYIGLCRYNEYLQRNPVPNVYLYILGRAKAGSKDHQKILDLITKYGSEEGK